LIASVACVVLLMMAKALRGHQRRESDPG
jgi:hypothetical protein